MIHAQKNQKDFAIKIRNLKKSFGSKHVLKGVNLDILRGESIAVIGASGTGKSVLIKNVIGLIKPDDGDVIVDDRRVADLNGFELDRFRRRFGMLFQGGALFDSMTVYDNVAFPMRERGGYSRDKIKYRVEELLDLVEMTGWEKYWPSDLSGGMKKRVSLARALATRPSIMLYDEPTTGLDPVVGGVIDRLIVRTRDQFKVTSITITHDMRSANRIAHRIAMLYQGRIIAAGTPDEIRKSPIPEVSEFVAERLDYMKNGLNETERDEVKE